MYYNDDFMNYKNYKMEKAKLILTDIPYCIGKNAYASSKLWWRNGNITNGESKKAHAMFFDKENNFSIDNFLQFCQDNLAEDGSVIVWCSHIQQFEIINKMKQYGFKKYIPLVFVKNNSGETLKVNMRIVGACEYGLQLIKNRLPEFHNNRKMIKNWFTMKTQYFTIKKVHPNQKPDELVSQFIELYTNPGDVVIDPCMGSGVVYFNCKSLNRKFYEFEVLKEYFDIIKEFIESRGLECVWTTDIPLTDIGSIIEEY